MNAGEGRSQIAFADTNVWLYALLATQDTEKSAKARAVIRESKLVTSTQVINEVCVNLLKKAGFSEEQVRALIVSFFERHPVAHLDKATLLLASSLGNNYRFSYWDSTMLASALVAGAEIFYSEDMHDGLVVENTMRLQNPFRAKSKASS